MFSLVSGAGSKVSTISQVPEMAYAAARPGFMVLVIRNDDAVDLYVHGGDPARVHCPQPDQAAQQECMEAGVEAFEVIFSARLRAGVPLPPADVIEDIAEPVEADTLQPADTVPDALIPSPGQERQP
jgi:hypothetical protein